jgi:hypothetical protein
MPTHRDYPWLRDEHASRAPTAATPARRHVTTSSTRPVAAIELSARHHARSRPTPRQSFWRQPVPLSQGLGGIFVGVAILAALDPRLFGLA